MAERDLTWQTKETIAATTSKGNQEKWYSREKNRWYKVDAHGFEALAEAVASTLLLRHSNVEKELGIPIVQYRVERATVHGHSRIVSESENFLQKGQSIVTAYRLLTNAVPDYRARFARARSLPEKICFLVDTVEEVSGLRNFGAYLTLLFEVDALILNDDRHLNNIAVLRTPNGFLPCPLFDNGSSFLLNIESYPFDIETRALRKEVLANPFQVSFARLIGAARKLYDPQLRVDFSTQDIDDILDPWIKWYPVPFQGYLASRIKDVLMEQKKRFFQNVW